MAKGKPWKFKYIEDMKIHTFMTFLSYKMEYQRLKAQLRKRNNDNEIQL